MELGGEEWITSNINEWATPDHDTDSRDDSRTPTRQQMHLQRQTLLWPAAGAGVDDGCTVKTRPAAGTTPGGATVAGRRRRDGIHPATGSHNPQAVRSSYINPTENSVASPL
ncbi:hypothetical protein ACLOJK_035155, partial [Asimina triloba]